MPIVQAGSINTASLVVPDLYVQIAKPAPTSLQGVNTHRVGVVGSATWGPSNSPVTLAPGDYTALFGPIAARQYDAGTAIALAAQQGASDFIAVRVTDGTDTAANYALLYSSGGYPVLFTAVHTGTLGNSISLALQAGSKAGTWQVLFQIPGQLPEVFDNLDPSKGNAAFWQSLVTAVNSGQSATRGPSKIVIASPGSLLTVAPSAVTNQKLFNGTDGVTGLTDQSLIGTDGSSRTGMYQLRNSGAALGVLADVTSSATYTVQSAFGESEGIYMMLVGPSGQSLAAAVAAKQAAGLDSYAAKLLFGDFLYWYDQTNSQTRAVSPQGVAAGILANLSPEQSSLNKRLSGIVGSVYVGLATSGQVAAFADADLESLFENGIDLITNPAPGGRYWAVRCGHNSSSSAQIESDSYTRLTNFIAETLASGMGSYVGSVINATLLNNIRATLLGYLGDLRGQGILGSTDGSIPYSVVCDATNNPQSRTSLGYVRADVLVAYQGINEKFIVNLTGGSSVTVASTANGTAS